MSLWSIMDIQKLRSGWYMNFFEQMIELGCPVESWPDLPPEVIADPGCHKYAGQLRKTTVLLPVHQSVDMSILGPMLSRALTAIAEVPKDL